MPLSATPKGHERTQWSVPLGDLSDALKMRRVYPVAEHESTAVVFGMPKEAIARGAADIIVPLPKIADQILAITSKSRR